MKATETTRRFATRRSLRETSGLEHSDSRRYGSVDHKRERSERALGTLASRRLLTSARAKRARPTDLEPRRERHAEPANHVLSTDMWPAGRRRSQA